MQPEREEMNLEDRRLKPEPENQQQHQQQQQPQKCPRCESLNTKFCYYNNYSLSQPRYFCKTCRRYWTQGGTLRNVPVGGGCRKGKRAKTSTSGQNSRSQAQPEPPLPPQQPSQQVQQNMANPPAIISSGSVMTTTPAMRTIEPGALPSQYYPGSGYLSSLAAIHSLNQSQPFDQALDVGTDQLAGNNSSNMSLLQGFSVSSFGSQQQQHQIQPSQTHFYQMAGNRDKSINESLYQSEENLIQTAAGRSTSSSSPHEWPHNFMNTSGATTASSESALWTMGNTKATANTTSAGSSFNPNQWPDLPGYGPPP
ncbi:hypothetical protein FEM48_Zijuj01G0157300 [Ziziphus jujuba var. spinosa]|uniref:Dof zinc finger protein n=1 Tax=Ziziphus jujuba var. spinosa TaxID=714518 RepID=A0A978W244_ZIZJJ|nr:hypothetical protein FEM48_Zijuj01G0157300 [Ziziphus jujuba var. spinosa]